MRKYLVFGLCAPMGSFGTYAGHERRGSDFVPQRSAILGLLGAALGITRTDLDSQEKLRHYLTAAYPLLESSPMRDYHTVQTVPRKIKWPATRRQALEKIGRDVETTITVRDYRTDVAIAIAVWTENEPWPLQEVEMALRQPVYTLYLGRKSCPLAAPLNPNIVNAPDPIAALQAFSPPEWLHPISPGTISCDPFTHGKREPNRIEMMPTEPLDRSIWHFGQWPTWHFDVEEADA